MTENALKKLLLEMLKDEYPQIKDIVVYSSDFMGVRTTYSVGLGIKYNDLLKMDEDVQDSLKKKIKHLSKYVLGKNEYLQNIFFYDPNDSY